MKTHLNSLFSCLCFVGNNCFNLFVIYKHTVKENLKKNVFGTMINKRYNIYVIARKTTILRNALTSIRACTL